MTNSKFCYVFCLLQADDNRDGVLTLNEMLNHEYIFYSTVYDASHEDDDDDDFHDELWSLGSTTNVLLQFFLFVEIFEILS